MHLLDETIEHPDLMASLEKLAADCPADEAGPAGNKNALSQSSLPLNLDPVIS